MNQAGYACAYVYDCCKLLRVFSAPVYSDRRVVSPPLPDPVALLYLIFSPPVPTPVPLLFPSLPSYLNPSSTTASLPFFFLSFYFLFYLFVSALVRFSVCCPAAQRLHPPPFEGCTSSSGSSNVLLVSLIGSTRRQIIPDIILHLAARSFRDSVFCDVTEEHL